MAKLLRALCGALSAVLISAWVAPPATAEDSAIAERRRSERKVFSDEEIVDGFFKTAFGAEFHLAGRVDRIRKYDSPVRVFVINKGRPDRRAQLAKIIADIGKRIQHLDIAITENRDEANFTVILVRDRDLNATLAAVYGDERAREIHRSLDPQCLSSFSKNEQFEIVRSDVILTVDNSDFVFHDCAYEELLQALGPINDTRSVPWTMFNDTVHMGYFDVYDQYVLNILYDPRIRPGMTVEEAKAALPDVLPAVRSFVGKTNGLPEPKR